jgi:gamma-glutamyltranspeptidase
MNDALHRRDALKLAAGHLVGLLAPRPVPADEKATAAKDAGRVVGQRDASEVGAGVLADGGNAVDATVAAALTASVVAISDVGIGGHMVIARARDQKVTAIDFSTAAPKAVRDDLFAGRKGSTYRWRTVGVQVAPLAGHLALLFADGIEDRQAWVIAHQELHRVQREGLLPASNHD